MKFVYRILTHDFTHRTHVVIFGFHYPRSLPNWSADDWITDLYEGFNLTHKLENTEVNHTLILGTRYNPTRTIDRIAILNDEIKIASRLLDIWLNKKKTDV